METEVFDRQKIKELAKGFEDFDKMSKSQQVRFENIIVDMFLRDPTVGRIEIKNGSTLGMYCAWYRLKTATQMALDDDVTSEMQNTNGYNIGMICALRGLKKEARKSLNNFTAATQQNIYGENVGMLCAMAGDEISALKALKNSVASVQQDVDGNCLGMHCYYNLLYLAGKIATENEDACLLLNYSGQTLLDIKKLCKADKLRIKRDMQEPQTQRAENAIE